MHKPTDEQIEVAEKIRSGEYFREARAMYDVSIHDPMVERYFYVLVSVLAAIIFLVSVIAVRGFYPLKHVVPFIVNNTNIVEEYPNIYSLIQKKGEDPGTAVLRFITQNYVQLREEYDINTFDRNMNGVKSQSSEQVVRELQNLTDPTNPGSPIALYQRHTRRIINVLSMKQVSNTAVEVTFEALAVGKTDVKKSTWQANITFNYSGVELDDDTGKVKPLVFTVTNYNTKRLQDVR